MADELYDEESLRELLNARLEQCNECLQRLQDAEFAEIEGISKMRTRIQSDIKFLKLFESGKKKLEKKYLETTNIIHLSNIIDRMQYTENLKSILQTFAIRKAEEETFDQKPSVDKHVVDIVGKKGKQWIKVISRSPRGVLMDWMAGSSRNIFEQARDYLDMSRNFRQSYAAPEIWFYFICGVPDKMAQQLEKRNIIVVGDRIDVDTLAVIPDDYLERMEEELMDIEDDDEEDDRLEGEEGSSLLAASGSGDNSTPPLNLDVSAVFVLISNMTHEGGTNHKFASKLLETQAEQERELPARLALLKELNGNERWIICQTAYESVTTILKTVSGPSEKARWEDLKKKLQVVPDVLSARTQRLCKSDRVNHRSMTIFGSGDYYRATTVTANKHFLSSAYHQGVGYEAIVHEPRALSEQKERPMDYDLSQDLGLAKKGKN